MANQQTDVGPKDEHRLDGALDYNGNRIEVLITELNNLSSQLVPLKLSQSDTAAVTGTPPNTDSSSVVAAVYAQGRRIDEAIGIVREQIEELEI